MALEELIRAAESARIQSQSSGTNDGAVPPALSLWNDRAGIR